MILSETITREWIRNAGDERAAHNGCRFDVLRGAWTIYWIERFCRLYEGEGYAGKPLVLHGCRECDHSNFWATQEPWWLDDECTIAGPAQEIHLERARLFCECVRNGHRIDWQYEFFMSLFGWVRHSDRWNREVRRFKRSRTYVAKKNKKSPSLAALGLYLLVGDGEPGNNVYLGAKDGEQAREIAGKHTVEMYLQSSELRAECTLNRNLMQITHEPSRSRLKPLSSSNSRTQKSKEGLNGSILIDEEHVVDREFINRIDRAGISRSESLFSSFSTAGNDPDSYGKEGFDYSLDVLSGKVTDEEHLACIHAVPQEVTDEQIESDFEKYAMMANPSLGHTVELRELRSDYERSKPKTENLANAMMYRFNKWQFSSNPWLSMGDWMKCAATYEENDLLGKDCFVSVDLALKWDTACIMCVFPLDDVNGLPRYRLWPYFFLPEHAARVTGDKVPWKTWSAKGHIHITNGNTTDFPLIRATINRCTEKFNLLGPVAYDKKFAEYLAQQLQDEDMIPVEEFPQQPNHFIEPMELLDAAVTDRRVEHPNNDVLNWQAGNATKGKNGMLVKPSPGGAGAPEDRAKKIDGIVAAVMAVGRAAMNLQRPSFYDNHALEMS